MQSATSNAAGHRAKYNHLTANMPLDEAQKLFVGGGDPILIGRQELDIIEAVRSVADADIVDVGCGIGRLTRHLVNEPISSLSRPGHHRGDPRRSAEDGWERYAVLLCSA